VHNCTEMEHVGHIFPHMTFAQFCTLQPNPISCYRLFLFLSDSFTTHSLLLRFSGVIFLGFLSTLSLYSTFLLFCFVIPPPLPTTLLLNVFNYVLLANGRLSKAGDSAPKETLFSTAWNSTFVYKIYC
jgi:hypothetical protein